MHHQQQNKWYPIGVYLLIYNSPVRIGQVNTFGVSFILLLMVHLDFPCQKSYQNDAQLDLHVQLGLKDYFFFS